MNAVAPLELVLVTQVEQGLRQLLRFLDGRVPRHADDGFQVFFVVVAIIVAGGQCGQRVLVRRRGVGALLFHLTDLQEIAGDVDLIGGMQGTVMGDGVAVDLDAGFR